MNEFEKGICPDEPTISENKYGVVNRTIEIDKHLDGKLLVKKAKVTQK